MSISVLITTMLFFICLRTSPARPLYGFNISRQQCSLDVTKSNDRTVSTLCRCESASGVRPVDFIDDSPLFDCVQTCAYSFRHRSCKNRGEDDTASLLSRCCEDCNGITISRDITKPFTFSCSNRKTGRSLTPLSRNYSPEQNGNIIIKNTVRILVNEPEIASRKVAASVKGNSTTIMKKCQKLQSGSQRTMNRAKYDKVYNTISSDHLVSALLSRSQYKYGNSCGTEVSIHFDGTKFDKIVSSAMQKLMSKPGNYWSVYVSNINQCHIVYNNGKHYVVFIPFRKDYFEEWS